MFHHYLLTAIAATIVSYCCPIEAKTYSTPVEKGFYDCHHSVYGRAEYRIPDVNPLPPVEEGRVPLTVSNRLRNVRFENHEFIIRHTGTYMVRYLFKAYLIPLDTVGFNHNINVAIFVNGIAQGGQKLQPKFIATVGSADYRGYFGTGMQYLRLKKGDKVSLHVTRIPSAGAVYANFGDPAEELDLAASLTIFKAETKK